MSKAKRYTLETLLPLNVSYDSDHGLTQEDVDMVNSLVEVIESTRSKHTPKIGDRVVYTQKGGEYHPHGLIEKKHEDKFYVCLDPFIPFVWESDTAIKVDVSGGFIERSMGGLVFRGVGIVRAKANVATTNLTYNITRLTQIYRYHKG